MTLYKVLGPDLRSCHGGDARWVPGEWQPPIPSPLVCKRGWHLLPRPRDVLDWWVEGAALWEAEGRGEMVAERNKQAWSEARVTRQLHLPTHEELVTLALDMAEHVLPVWERAHPDYPRPREAIAAARRGDAKTAATAADATAGAATYAAYAADAAYAAADACAATYAAYAADAAYAAADAAYAAAYAADATAYAGAASAAAGAAYAAAYAAGFKAETSWQDQLLKKVIYRD